MKNTSVPASLLYVQRAAGFWCKGMCVVSVWRAKLSPLTQSLCALCLISCKSNLQEGGMRYVHSRKSKQETPVWILTEQSTEWMKADDYRESDMKHEESSHDGKLTYKLIHFTDVTRCSIRTTVYASHLHGRMSLWQITDRKEEPSKRKSSCDIKEKAAGNWEQESAKEETGSGCWMETAQPTEKGGRKDKTRKYMVNYHNKSLLNKCTNDCRRSKNTILISLTNGCIKQFDVYQDKP